MRVPFSGPVPVMEEIAKIQPTDKERTASKTDDLLTDSDSAGLVH